MPPPRSGAPKLRIMIVDDHRIVAEGLRASLCPDHDVVGVAHDGNELLGLLKRADADCLLLDVEMPGRNGLQLIPHIRRLHQAMKIIVLTMAADPVIAEAAMSAGAHGFVPKEAPMSELKAAIREVCDGGRHVSARVPKTSHRVGVGAAHPYLHRLTPRQQQIVLLVGEGKSLTEIASDLHVGASTVTFHKQNIMRVLGIDTDGAFVRHAVLVRAGTRES